MLIIYSNYQLHAHKRILQSVNLGRDGDLNLDSRLQADAGLLSCCQQTVLRNNEKNSQSA
jgi:hypothetical protein